MTADESPQARDRAFWPPLPSLFDLTLKFEETILGILPSTAIAAIAPFIIAHYAHEPIRVRRSWHLWAKITAAAALSALEVASLACRATSPDFRTATTLPSASLDLVAALALVIILYYEHMRTVRSSAIVSVYLFLALAVNAVKSRSYFLRSGLAANGALAAATCSIILLLLILQELPKTKLLLDSELKATLGGEAASGFWTRSFLLYLNPMFLIGYSSILQMKHLSNLGPELRSKLVHARLSRYWPRKARERKASLMAACFWAWKAEALAIFIPRLASTGFNFSQPFIIYQIIKVVESGDLDARKAGALLGATVISFAGSTLTNMMTTHLGYRLVTRVRGGLVSELFQKTLKLPQSEAKKSAAVTLMSADIDGIATGLPGVYDIVMTVLEIGLGTYLLSGFVGRSCFTVFIPIFLSTVITHFISGHMASAFLAWNESLEIRVAKTSKVLSQLTLIKTLGLGPTIERYLQTLRKKEVSASSKYRILHAVLSMPVIAADLLTPVVVIAAALFWKTFDGRFSAATVFPSLTIIALIKVPLTTLLSSYPHIRSMLGCFKRIEEFLNLPEQEDPRTVIAQAKGGQDSDKPRQFPTVEFIGAKIAPLGSQIPILRDLNFCLQPGSLTAVAGPNGSGKSSLLQSILGETELLDGSIQHTDEAIGFCDQSVWLRNVSIKDNIIGPLPYEAGLFDRIVQCVLLDEDLSRLAGGADYIVGSGGSKLSGGQRQRVGIARTFYARMSVVVLDDVFSALDKKTAMSILFHLFGEDGLVKELNCAAIIATNLSACVDLADQVLVLDGKGQAKVETRSGLPQSRDKVFAHINLTPFFKHGEDDVKEQEAIRLSLDAQKNAAANQVRAADRRKGNRSFYRLYIEQIGYGRLIGWSVGMFLAAAGEIFPEIYMRLWIDRHPRDNTYFAGYAAISAITCFIFGATTSVLDGDLSPRAALGLHLHLAMTIIRATVGFLSGTDHGEILNRFSQDMTILVRNMPGSLMRTFYTLFLSTVNTGVILSGASYMAVVLPGILFVVYLIQRFYLRTSRQLRALDLETKTPLYTHFEETAQGLLHIRAFGWTDPNLNEALTLLDESQKAFYYMYCIQLWLVLVLGLLSAALSGVLVALALFIIKTSSGPAVGLAFLNIMSFSALMQGLIEAWTHLETSVSSLSRLQHLMEDTPQEKQQSLVELPLNWPSMGNIVMENVHAAYSENIQKDSILKDFNLSVESGSRLGVIGRTGSGKSSLFMALLGFLQYEGVMKIDGIDVSSIAPDELRSRIVTISQGVLTLDASVRVNLLPFTINDAPPATEEEKQAAANRDIKLRELLIRLGLWSQVSGKGDLDAKLDDVGYSHGEMQLFALARGVLRCEETGSRVVLIDEATSSVELEREKSAQVVMNEYFADCTVLIIGHKKSSVRGVNATVELAGGKVVHTNPAEPESDEDVTSARSHHKRAQQT